jgi:serine/threonine protein kinase
MQEPRHFSSAAVGTPLADGRYRVTEVLGEGAMARVYRGTHVALDREVAIKILRPDLPRPDDFAERFRREAMAASAIDHPNVVRVLDYGHSEHGYFLVMELLAGTTLEALLASAGPCETGWIAETMSQTLAGLAAAHDHGVVHRDVKPENVMMVVSTSDDGETVWQAKLCDFGLAKLDHAPESAEISMRGGQPLILGTPAYMSPEQTVGAGLDHRTDLYACGVMLYELATGALPFDGSAESVRRQHITRPPPYPSTVFPDIDPALEEVILRALEKAPEDRFQSAREMRDALLSIVDRPVFVTPARNDLPPASNAWVVPTDDESDRLSRASLREAGLRQASPSARVGGWLSYVAVLGALGAGLYYFGHEHRHHLAEALDPGHLDVAASPPTTLPVSLDAPRLSDSPFASTGAPSTVASPEAHPEPEEPPDDGVGSLDPVDETIHAVASDPPRARTHVRGSAADRAVRATTTPSEVDRAWDDDRGSPASEAVGSSDAPPMLNAPPATPGSIASSNDP